MATNGGIIEEIMELEKSGELPTNISRRLLFAGIIKNANVISTLVGKESTNASKIGTLEKLIAFLSTLVLALLGWTVFAG